MDGNTNPLDKLFVESHSLDYELLANAILPYVRLHKGGEIELTWEGEQLTFRQKLLAFLLARKALKESRVIEDEAIGPSEIEKDTGWNGGSIRPTLAKLKKEKLVRNANSEEGGYFVPNYALKTVSEILRSASQPEDIG